ncbi:DUF1643 domain-containing protein [Oscillospiraceae bacterium PP1C4]
MNEKSNIRTEALYNDEKTHRFSLKKSWDNSKPSASIIMISPSSRANEVAMDVTSLYVLNNCFQLGYGSVDILNLYSKLDSNPFENCPENNEWILKSCQKADRIILAWGKGQTQKAVDNRIQEVIQLLEPCKDKLFEIADDTGKHGYHPLGASVRLKWNLVEYQYPEKEKQEQTKP